MIGKILQDLSNSVSSFPDVILGQDLLFWMAYIRWFVRVVQRDEYVPALKYRLVNGDLSRDDHEFAIYPGWKIASSEYMQQLNVWASRIPPVAAAGFLDLPSSFCLLDPETLLSHFSEVFLTDLVINTPLSVPLYAQVKNTLILECYELAGVGSTTDDRQRYLYWLNWYYQLVEAESKSTFYLCFHLSEPQVNQHLWSLEFYVVPRDDPSNCLALTKYWHADSARRHRLGQQFGADFERAVKLNLEQAARIFPKLQQALTESNPTRIVLTLDDVNDFISDWSWVLEAAGYRVIIPAWCSPDGQRRARLRLKAKSKALKSSSGSKLGHFSTQTLIDYRYDLAIGDEVVSEADWVELLALKSQLIQFRGQWVYLNPQDMEQILDFWRQQPKQTETVDLIGFLQVTAQVPSEVELAYDSQISSLMSRLQSEHRIKLLPDPKGLENGRLRPYQQRGLSWIAFLESLGLNGCLADEMGLGKSLTLISRLLHEREQGLQVGATLLIAPISVIGNWVRECQRFSPQLRIYIHHGGSRVASSRKFAQIVSQHDLVITTFGLVRSDKLLLNIHWHRVVVDEAQNIKNPGSSTTRAIFDLNSTHRLALTGTPVENCLMDLWSIFHFLNPGYLGRKTDFRKRFELAIQKNEDREQASLLKRLVQPFILRRVKTDPAIIQDLPEKNEQLMYCHLTQEQAALYQAVVEKQLQSIASAEGIQRKGLMLQTLTLLKQICNHPAHYLQDGSEFTPKRSRKVDRLFQMTEEVLSDQESCLIFTQFTEAGNSLAAYMRHHYQWNVYYLNGSTPRKQRDQMIAEFQEAQTGPAVFILSIRAGGVGINLTRANHVFHFDRWWNPAVENQATDRAFRIGQTRNVFVHKFVTLGTVEERIERLLQDKKRVADLVVESGESWLTSLDAHAFGDLIQLRGTGIFD
ncbi:DEAD/DEAH box helicase [Leptolyngbya sp. AN03gr2]|uniref:DEAD/DEAH box helicase n=1 Tax=Leptolyngbya sp. AN03gr2 TaxID=3423364 RepID=UPI003D31C11C